MVLAKTVDLKISSSKKGIKKEIKKERSKNAKQDSDISKLKAELAKLKQKKVARGHVSEYNLFVRKQIRAGLNFTQAAKQWSKYKALQDKDKRRPSAYNQFIGSQMRLGKTFTQSVAMWKLAKAGKLGKKGKTRTVTKTVVRRIKSKPQIKYRTRSVSRPVHSSGATIASLQKLISQSHVSSSEIRSALSPDDEEIAFKIVQTYFKEIARLGFKRQLSLDEIINAYFYALARVKRQDTEMSEVSQAVKDAGMRK